MAKADPDKIGVNRGNAGKGRPKGAENKNTRAIKDMILAALDAKGGQAWLEKQMVENPTAMLSLIGKIIPTQITGGDEGTEPLTIRIIKPDA